MTRSPCTLAAVLLAGALLVAGGCHQESSRSMRTTGGRVGNASGDERITVEDEGLERWLEFDEAVILDGDEEAMRVEIPVGNLSDNTFLVEYRMLFDDAGGSEITPAMEWRMSPVEPGQTVRLAGSTSSEDAVDWRLEVRWAR